MSYKARRNTEQEVVWSVMQAIGKLMLLPFRGAGSGKRTRGVLHIHENDKVQIEQKWLEIRELMQANGASHFRMAILHADAVLDTALKALQIPGNTLGERLKEAERLFTAQTYHLLWQAHKVRNRLAHEIDSEVMSWEAREAVASFEQGLREIGALSDRH